MPVTKSEQQAQSLFEPRWRELIRHLKFADQVAYRMLLQAPWPTATDLMETDVAFQLVARHLPEHQDIESRNERFTELLSTNREAAEMWDSLNCDLQAHVQDYAFLLGWAFGARLGPNALTPPAAIARLDGGAQ
jgi:hypothetical protein